MKSVSVLGHHSTLLWTHFDTQTFRSVDEFSLNKWKMWHTRTKCIGERKNMTIDQTLIRVIEQILWMIFHASHIICHDPNLWSTIGQMISSIWNQFQLISWWTFQQSWTGHKIQQAFDQNDWLQYIRAVCRVAYECCSCWKWILISNPMAISISLSDWILNVDNIDFWVSLLSVCAI